MNQEDIDDFREALPPQYRGKLNTEIMEHIHKKMSDPDMYEDLRDKMISYTNVFQHGKFRMINYLDGIRYISYKSMGMTNEKAYAATFPKKVKKWKKSGMSSKNISSYVSQYNKSKLIVMLYERALIPFKLLNQENLQKAVNKQVELLNARSEMVQQLAANSLMTHLAPSETTTMELDVQDKQNTMIDELRKATTEMVNAQRKQLEDGVIDASTLAASNLLSSEIEDGEIIEDD